MRRCWKCKVEVEGSGRGRSVCEDCRSGRSLKPCEQCGRPTQGRGRLCAACIWQRDGKHPCDKCGAPCTKRATVCRPCRIEAMRGAENPSGSGAANGRWKGGRIRNGGYVYVLDRGHPASPASGYVAEHVLVMEELLGRYLERGENVHHRNGVRDDNQPENLELWVRSQPAGQRVEDLVAWAKELLMRYDPTALYDENPGDGPE